MSSRPSSARSVQDFWPDRRVVLFDGQHDTRIKTGEDYRTLSLADIFGMAPFSRDKQSSPAIIPSVYADFDAREHARQRSVGQFVALCGDVDTGDHGLDTIRQPVEALADGSAWLIYSSAHARDGDMRWRIIVPLEDPLPFADWHDAQCAFFDIMEATGIAMDRAMARAAQPVYLPNVPAVHAKSGTPLRGASGAPIYYQSASTSMTAPGITITAGALADGIRAIRQRRADDDRARENIRRQAEKRRANRPHTDGASIIDDFNAGTSVATMLAQIGYEQSPRSTDDWRSTLQTGDTFATKIINGKWVSLSGTDAAAGIGETCDAGCYGDAYDLYVHFEHGGNHKAAFRQLHFERAGPNVVRARFSAEPPPAADGDPGYLEMPDWADSGGIEDRSSTPQAAVADETDRADAPIKGEGVGLIDFYAYMPAAKYIFAPSRELWPATSVNSRVPAQKALDRNGNPIKRDGEIVYVPASQWLAKERAVEQMTWAPGEPMIVTGRLVSEGGWITRKGCSCFNLYRPPICAKGTPALASRWIQHVYRVYPDDADHIITWLAHRVQRPQEKINHALVLGGNQGIGKDTLLEPAKYGVGAWNCSEVSPQQLVGRFNGFLKAVIMRVSEARDLGEIDRYGFYEHMKTYTAAPPDVLRVDEKNIREHAIFNVVGVIITTNNKANGIYLPADDRRHYVAWSELTKDDFGEDYWSNLWQWYDAGGRAHVAAYLRTLDISGFNPKAPPPKTPAWFDIVNSNRSSEDAELADALDGIGWPAAITISMVAGSQTCAASFATFLQDRRNSRQIPHKLETADYVSVRNDGAKDGLWKVGGKRQAIYAKKELAVRERTAAAAALGR
jgi:hypothetical protein